MKPCDEALVYIKERYNEEILTSEYIENKCTRYLTVITLILIGFGGILSFYKSAIFNPDDALGYISLGLVLCSIAALLSSFSQLLMCLKVQTAIAVPRGESTSEWLRLNDQSTVVEFTYKCYANAVAKQLSFNDNKIKPLKIAHTDLVIAVWLMSLTALLQITLEIAK